jgi:hypothetical protein
MISLFITVYMVVISCILLAISLEEIKLTRLTDYVKLISFAIFWPVYTFIHCITIYFQKVKTEDDLILLRFLIRFILTLLSILFTLILTLQLILIFKQNG